MKAIKVHEQDGCKVVRFQASKLTADDQILHLSDELKEVLESVPSGSTLVLDFQDVEIVASMLLGDLVTLSKEASRQKVALQLWHLSSDVLRVFSMCQLDRLFDIVFDEPVD
ncbi:MAG: STAS domain-containing protein [Planctomycetaceae bacterium]|nr:STAS domain-containing protein [Planctomycetales bacterium]MCB9927700.1 STAS domain-containing protein [Planctomycetaceae bacterium]